MSQIAIGVIIDIDLAQQNQVALVVGAQLLDGSRHRDVLTRGVGLRQIVAVGDTSDILCLQETILVSDVHRHRTIERSTLFERERGAHQVDGLATLAHDIVGAVTIDHLCIGELQRSGSHIGSTGHQVVDGVGRTNLATTRLVTTRTFYGDLGKIHGARIDGESQLGSSLATDRIGLSAFKLSTARGVIAVVNITASRLILKGNGIDLDRLISLKFKARFLLKEPRQCAVVVSRCKFCGLRSQGQRDSTLRQRRTTTHIGRRVEDHCSRGGYSAEQCQQRQPNKS